MVHQEKFLLSAGKSMRFHTYLKRVCVCIPNPPYQPLFRLVLLVIRSCPTWLETLEHYFELVDSQRSFTVIRMPWPEGFRGRIPCPQVLLFGEDLPIPIISSAPAEPIGLGRPFRAPQRSRAAYSGMSSVPADPSGLERPFRAPQRNRASSRGHRGRPSRASSAKQSNQSGKATQ